MPGRPAPGAGPQPKEPTGDRAANLTRAIACYEVAVRGYEAAGLADEAARVKRRLAALRQSGDSGAPASRLRDFVRTITEGIKWVMQKAGFR